MIDKTLAATTAKKTTFWEIAQTALLAFILAQLLVRFVVQPHHVSGASMEPTFSDGDYILTDKITYRLRNPQRGEVIIFHPPQNSSVEYIKRIVGLPGDTIELKSGLVYVNNKQLNESYLAYIPEKASMNDTVQGADKIIVPDGTYFALGDNRNNSYDSRYFGAIEEHLITGKAVFRYWPINEVQAVTTPNFSF